VWHSVARTIGMPRPAKPARQTKYARKTESGYNILAPNRGTRLEGKPETPTVVSEMRAWLVCRAGFAGRGTPVARPTERHTRAFHPDPRRSLGSAF